MPKGGFRSRSGSQSDPLCDLAVSGNIEGLLHAIDVEGRPVDGRKRNSKTPLSEAVRRYDYTMVHELLNRGADVNFVDNLGFLCHGVSSASRNDAVKMAEILLDAGANPHESGGYQRLSRSIRVTGTVPALTGSQAAQAAAREVIDRYARMPSPESQEEFSKEALFRRDENGLSLLQVPETWRRWRDISAELRERGQRFTKEELLAPGVAGEASLMERAIRCRAVGAVMEDLTQAGETLTMRDILPDGKQPADWVRALGETRQMGVLFRAHLWEGKSAADLKALHNALPPEHREQVPNYHRLQTALQQSENVLQRPGR